MCIMKTLSSILMGGLLVLCSCGQPAQKEVADSSEDKNAVVEAIMARRSIRKYTDQPVEREKLQLIMDCGINAPSGMNQQPWEVRVVDNADYINGITEIYKKANPKAAEEPGFKNMFRNAPAVIFVASPKNGSGQLDCGMLGENMMLAALSLDLGTCCLGGPIRFMKTNEEAAPYLQKLAFSDDYELLYAIAVGYPDEAPAAKPRSAQKAMFVD